MFLYWFLKLFLNFCTWSPNSLKFFFSFSQSNLIFSKLRYFLKFSHGKRSCDQFCAKKLTKKLNFLKCKMLANFFFTSLGNSFRFSKTISKRNPVCSVESWGSPKSEKSILKKCFCFIFWVLREPRSCF